MWGLILNASDPERTKDDLRYQNPVFVLDDGYPVFEVWFYHWELQRWFVMSHVTDPALAAAGVVFFATLDQLRQQIRQLGGTPRG